MRILFQKAGKKFNREWIFRHVDLEINSGDRIVILGPNGSGKSTFLQLSIGSLMSTEGALKWEYNGMEVLPDEVYRQIAFAAPYLELPEEFTLRELIDFHFRFKSRMQGLTDADLIELSGLAPHADKVVRYFSSGMKQRVRLLLAFCSDTPVLVLDEPCSNLDQDAIQWYGRMTERFTGYRTVIVGSNRQEPEYAFCNRQVELSQWKFQNPEKIASV